jgi:peptidoglycan/LPS O-acetylase OafA/YrhL
VLGAAAVSLLCLNSRLTPWEGLFIPACMFLGTAVFRADQGAVARRRVGVAAAALLFLAVVSALTAKPAPGVSAADRAIEARTYVLSALLAAAMFGAGLLLRQRSFPRILGWFGEISFSIYLLHPLLSAAFVRTLHRYGGSAAPAWRQLATCGVFFGVVAACASVTYLAIEQPTQRLGRAVSRWCDARFGPYARSTLGGGRVAELSPR